MRAALRAWAAGLGVATFHASNGRVYPMELKAAPLLRALDRALARPRRALRHEPAVDRPGARRAPPAWHLPMARRSRRMRWCLRWVAGRGRKPGPTARWLAHFESLGIACHALEPANCGWEHPWPAEILAAAEGQPLKNITVSAGDTRVAGELLITRYGLEGGAIYQLGPALRAMRHPAIAIDFKPTFSHAELVAKMQSVRGDVARRGQSPLAAGRGGARRCLAATAGRMPRRWRAR